LAELRCCGETQFDPRVVAVFTALIEERTTLSSNSADTADTETPDRPEDRRPPDRGRRGQAARKSLGELTVDREALDTLYAAAMQAPELKPVRWPAERRRGA
jgi:hypothetical protein